MARTVFASITPSALPGWNRSRSNICCISAIARLGSLRFAPTDGVAALRAGAAGRGSIAAGGTAAATRRATAGGEGFACGGRGMTVAALALDTFGFGGVFADAFAGAFRGRRAIQRQRTVAIARDAGAALVQLGQGE